MRDAEEVVLKVEQEVHEVELLEVWSWRWRWRWSWRWRHYYWREVEV
jgi:hypothetical protein